MQRCANCRTEFETGVESCPSCGAPAEHACPSCGTEYEASDACPACGKLNGSAECAEHPDRSATGRCVICGRAVCNACRSARGAVCLCRDHARVSVIQGWAQVYSTGSEFEAQLLRENLQAEGIDAQTFSQRDHMLTVDLGDLSLVRLLVPVWEYDAARAVIQQHMDDEGEVAFACPTCGEAYEPGARECTGCGAALA